MPSRFSKIVNVCACALKAIESGSAEKLAENIANEDGKYDRNVTAAKIANRLKICVRGIVNTAFLPLSLVVNATRVVYDVVEYFSQENPQLRDSKDLKNSLAAFALTPLTPLFGLVCIAQPLVSLPQIAIEHATGQVDRLRAAAPPGNLRVIPERLIDQRRNNLNGLAFNQALANLGMPQQQGGELVGGEPQLPADNFSNDVVAAAQNPSTTPNLDQHLRGSSSSLTGEPQVADRTQ